MDIGASYGGYAADITRTVPVGGRFSPEQREIYQLVRDAQAVAEEMARPGVSRDALARAAAEVLAEGLAELGLIESPFASYEDELGRELPSTSSTTCTRSATGSGSMSTIRGPP